MFFCRVKTAKKKLILLNRCVRKVVEDLNKSQYFKFADKTFCKTVDVTHLVAEELKLTLNIFLTPRVRKYRDGSTLSVRSSSNYFIVNLYHPWIVTVQQKNVHNAGKYYIPFNF